MAKGAANEEIMGDLHAKVAQVFLRVLESYERAELVADDVEDEAMRELLSAGPNPAMMSAITKFLKDNSIDFDNEEIEKLSDTEQRLQARKARRSNLVTLGNLALVDPNE